MDKLQHKDIITNLQQNSAEKKFRIKKNKGLTTNLKASLGRDDVKIFHQSMIINPKQESSPTTKSKPPRILAKSRETEEDVVIDTPEDETVYDKHSNGVDPDQQYAPEKLTTIVESPNVDRHEHKTTEESKSIKVMSDGTPESDKYSKPKKVVLKKSMIQEMEKKLHSLKKVQDKPKLDLKIMDISIVDKDEANAQKITKHPTANMNITENITSVGFK